MIRCHMIYALHDSEEVVVHPIITIANSLMLCVIQIVETTTTRVTQYNTIRGLRFEITYLLIFTPIEL